MDEVIALLKDILLELKELNRKSPQENLYQVFPTHIDPFSVVKFNPHWNPFEVTCQSDNQTVSKEEAAKTQSQIN